MKAIVISLLAHTAITLMIWVSILGMVEAL